MVNLHSEGTDLRLNVGCGYRKLTHYINIDKQTNCDPDVLLDVESAIWPWPSASVERVLFNHSLEHMGSTPDVFVHIITEMYRVCIPNAVVEINVPHPRHDHFLMDPTHVRPITPELFSLFDLDKNRAWIAAGAANTPLAIYTGIDLRVVRVKVILTDFYERQRAAGTLTNEDVTRLISERNNIAQEYQMELRVIK